MPASARSHAFRRRGAIYARPAKLEKTRDIARGILAGGAGRADTPAAFPRPPGSDSRSRSLYSSGVQAAAFATTGPNGCRRPSGRCRKPLARIEK